MAKTQPKLDKKPKPGSLVQYLGHTDYCNDKDCTQDHWRQPGTYGKVLDCKNPFWAEIDFDKEVTPVFAMYSHLKIIRNN